VDECQALLAGPKLASYYVHDIGKTDPLYQDPDDAGPFTSLTQYQYTI